MIMNSVKYCTFEYVENSCLCKIGTEQLKMNPKIILLPFFGNNVDRVFSLFLWNLFIKSFLA